MRPLLIAIALILPTNIAAQPFSESMMDCAAIYQNAAQWVDADEAADKLMYAAVRWADAAAEQVQKEGGTTSSDLIWNKIDVKTSDWEAKGREVFFSQDFRDWMQYCRKFAQSRSIAIEP